MLKKCAVCGMKIRENARYMRDLDKPKTYYHQACFKRAKRGENATQENIAPELLASAGIGGVVGGVTGALAGRAIRGLEGAQENANLSALQEDAIRDQRLRHEENIVPLVMMAAPVVAQAVAGKMAEKKANPGNPIEHQELIRELDERIKKSPTHPFAPKWRHRLAALKAQENPGRGAYQFGTGELGKTYEVTRYGKYVRRRLRDPEEFDKRSFRTITVRSPKGVHKLIIGCPKGQWDAQRQKCKVGTRAQSLLYPMHRLEELQARVEAGVLDTIDEGAMPEEIPAAENTWNVLVAENPGIVHIFAEDARIENCGVARRANPQENITPVNRAIQRVL